MSTRKTQKHKILNATRKSPRKRHTPDEFIAINSSLLDEEIKRKEVNDSVIAFEKYLLETETMQECDEKEPTQKDDNEVLCIGSHQTPPFYNTAVLKRGLDLGDYKSLVTPTSYLSDNVILTMTNYMSSLPNQWTGMQDTAQHLRPIPVTSRKHLQILHVNTNHWVLSCKSGKQVLPY